MSRLLFAILIPTVFLTPAKFARADAGSNPDTFRVETSSERAPNPSADASYDKRLPPVYPGEEVADGKKKIKVWSTAGSVAGGAPSSAGSPPQVPVPGAVGVIVDRRDGERAPRDHD
ncbi:MAG: hypothetical protein K1X83_01745 [Oligoflexia bacterium]|nr:hypothetical protein [Oligoflexia bacterium]